MPPKATPKKVESAELMDLSGKIISIAQRGLVNKQFSMDVYKGLINASNVLTDEMIKLEAVPTESK